jgi:FkbM family methyltransferase
MLSNKDFVNNTYDNFYEYANKKKVIVFGVGESARRIIEEDFYDLDILYFVDNDIQKQGGFFSVKEKKLPIHSPKAIESEKNDYVVLIASIYDVEIKGQLEQMGCVDNYFSFKRLLRSHKMYRVGPEEDQALVDSNVHAINSVRNMLSDEKSKVVFDTVIRNARTGDNRYTEIAEDGQYFDLDIVIPIPNEVFVDVGTFDGSTIASFLKFCQQEYAMIYGFDADRMNFKKCQERFGDIPNIELVNKALWNKNTKLYFTEAEGDKSHISENGKTIVEAVTLDDFFSSGERGAVTFIKMDIEGAEMEALEGSKNTILQYKPRLALSIYHHTNHYWEIPLYVKQLVPEYRFYVRHYHFAAYYDTVLYAVL